MEGAVRPIRLAERGRQKEVRPSRARIGCETLGAKLGQLCPLEKVTPHFVGGYTLLCRDRGLQTKTAQVSVPSL
jgi:hypothetical protein